MTLVLPEITTLDDWYEHRDWLVAQRQRLGIGQRQLGTQMGVSQGRVSELESGRYQAPRLSTVNRYVHALQELAAGVELPPSAADEPAVRHRRRPQRHLMHDELKARVLELLGDGKWHNYEQVIREVGKLVPPGLAIRQAESERLKGRRRREVRTVALPIERQIESGRRALVRSVLKRPELFETDRPGDPNHRQPNRQIRLRRDG